MRERACGACAAARQQQLYLVDPASNHMLVSKIKPCMSKYKPCTRRDCGRLIKSVMIPLGTDFPWITCGNSGANTCNKAPTPSSWRGKGALIRRKPIARSAGVGGRHPSNCRRSHGLRAGDTFTEFLIYHADDGWCYANRGVNG